MIDLFLTPASSQSAPLSETAIRSETERVEVPALLDIAAQHYRKAARIPYSTVSLQQSTDPILQNRTVQLTTAVSPNNSNVRLTAYPGAVFFEAPDEVTLYAVYQNDGNALAPRTLTGLVFGEDGKILGVIELVDDGEELNSLGRAHKYRGSFALPKGHEQDYTGIHSIVVQAPPSGFQQESLMTHVSYSYGAPGVRLTGIYSDRVIEGNLEIAAHVYIAAPGRFHLEASLYAGDGRAVAWAQNAIELDSGFHEIPLLFDGGTIRDLGVDGPFVLKYISVSRASSFPQVKGRLIQDAHITGAYRASEFTASFRDDALIMESNKLSPDASRARR